MYSIIASIASAISFQRKIVSIYSVARCVENAGVELAAHSHHYRHNNVTLGLILASSALASQIC